MHLNRKLLPMMVRGAYSRAPSQRVHDMDGERYLIHKQGAHENDGKYSTSTRVHDSDVEDLYATQFISTNQLYILHIDCVYNVQNDLCIA